MHLEPSQIEDFETDGAILIKGLFHDWDTRKFRILEWEMQPGDVCAQQPFRQPATLSAEVDLRFKVGARIRVRHGFIHGDRTVLVELEKRFIEGDHTLLTAVPVRFLNA